MKNNPFYNRGPIREPSFFFDRQTEVERALDLLKRGQSLSVIGPRRIGKTSFLRYLAVPEVCERYGAMTRRLIFAFVDCQELESQSQNESYACIVEAIEDALPATVRDTLPQIAQDRPMSYASLRRMIKHLSRSDYLVVIMFDEFEYIARNACLDTSFFPSLRSLTVKYNVAFVTATFAPLAKLRYARSSDAGSPFFNFFFPLRLGLFVSEASRRMVQTLLQRGQIELHPSVVDWILQAGGNHPFLIQVAGYWACELVRESEKLGTRNAKRLRSAIYQDLEDHFLYWWHHLSLQEQEALAALPGVHLTAELERLMQFGLVIKEGKIYDLFSPLFGTFVGHQELPGVLRAGLLRFDLRQRQVFIHDQLVDLTPSQYQALRFMAERVGQLAPYEELEQEIWPGECYQGPDRIKGLISKLRAALGPLGSYIENRRGFGYVLELPE